MSGNTTANASEPVIIHCGVPTGLGMRLCVPAKPTSHPSANVRASNTADFCPSVNLGRGRRIRFFLRNASMLRGCGRFLGD